LPELPEVETIVRDLRPDLQGRAVLAAEVYWPRTVATSTVEAFQCRVAGQRVEAVGRRGKYVTLRLSGGDWLLIHLKMTGHLQVMPEGAPAEPYVRAVFRLDDGRQLRFRDQRKFGRLHLTDDPKGVLGDLGPEPLADDFTGEAFAALLRRRRGRLKPLLLNQRFLAPGSREPGDDAQRRGLPRRQGGSGRQPGLRARLRADGRALCAVRHPHRADRPRRAQRAFLPRVPALSALSLSPSLGHGTVL